MPDASAAIVKPQLIFVYAAACLIGVFLWRAFVPAQAYPMRAEQILDIAFDTILLVCLVGVRVGLKRPSAGGLGKLDALFWVGLAAGLGLFAIRFGGGNASWWTGHLTVVPLG